MKNLYIHGSFMNDNYGDFLLYYVIERIVERYEKDYTFYSADVDKSYDNYCKVKRLAKNKAVRSADLAIFAGGGYFGEPSKRRILWNLRCLIKHILPAYRISRRKIPYIIVGIEVGPISFLPNRLLLKRIFNNAERVSVRNEESKKFLKKIHVKNDIMVNPDWIMGINQNDLPYNNVDVSGLIKKENNEKVLFVHLTTKNNNEGMNNVVVDLKKFQDENEVVYIIGCDQKRNTQEERAKVLFDSLDNKCNKLCLYHGPWHLSKVLSSVDAVITDKLHVGIVSTKFNKEVVSVASHPKTVRFYKLIGRDEWTSLITKIKPGETYSKLKRLKIKPIELDESIFESAKENEKLVVRFLDDYCEKHEGYD